MVGGGLEQFSVSPRPLGFGFGNKGFRAKGMGPGLDNELSQKRNITGVQHKINNIRFDL